MAEHSLSGCRVLVVEDEYFLADDLRTALEDAGATVLGPVANVADAAALANAAGDFDGAILDVNLGGELVFGLADLLRERQVPFILATGYDESFIPERFADVPRCDKPLNMHRIAAAIGKSIHR